MGINMTPSRRVALFAVLSAALFVAGCGATVGDPCTTEQDCGKQVCLNKDYTPGGYKYHAANAEYILKINDPLRFVLFADGGFGYNHRDPWDLSKTRFSTGAELRIFLPVFQFPLRFIYALNPQRKPGDRFESFQFTIGNTY